MGHFALKVGQSLDEAGHAMGGGSLLGVPWSAAGASPVFGLLRW